MKKVETFYSRPDLNPSKVEVTTAAQDIGPGYVFVAPKKGPGQDGTMIVDNQGQVVWFRSVQQGQQAMDFRVQRYRGEPVLAWWEGQVDRGNGRGEYVIFDSSYREIARVHAGNGYAGDLHDFIITPQDTALLLIYDFAERDLSSAGGPSKGEVWDGIVQEVDIETGRVLFEWHSLDHVRLDETYSKPEDSSRSYAPDYFHINSVDLDTDGNLLVSGRNTHAIYKIDRKTGDVMWRLGGKRSDFKMGPGTWFAYQHDARRQPDGTLSIFDNGGSPFVNVQSRGIVLELDMETMTAELARTYPHPKQARSGSQGNMQVLPNGNVFIGWGSEPFFSEFDRTGRLVFDGRFPPKDESYRAYRFEWTGSPSDAPDIAVRPQSGSEVTIYASWNGATEVDNWQVLTGPSADQLQPVASASRDGFETVITARTAEPYVAIQARDSSGHVLGTSRTAPVVELSATGAGGTSQRPSSMIGYGVGVMSSILALGEHKEVGGITRPTALLCPMSAPAGSAGTRRGRCPSNLR